MRKDHLIENCKANAIDKIYRLPPRGKHSSIIQRFRPVLLGWWAEVQNRHMMWFHEVLMEEPENADGEYYLPHFHRFALQSVVDFLQVLASQWDGGISWECWTLPAPSTYVDRFPDARIAWCICWGLRARSLARTVLGTWLLMCYSR